MGNNFLLKDDGGNLLGYACQAADEIRCRVNAAKHAKVTLVFEDGSSCVQEASGHEQILSCAGKKLAGCCLEENGRVLCAAGMQPVKAMRVHRSEAHASNRTETEKNATGESRINLHTDLSTAQPAAIAERMLPQRRWPQPPCMPQAVYRNGQWSEVE